jgi:hypothetical protein
MTIASSTLLCRFALQRTRFMPYLPDTIVLPGLVMEICPAKAHIHLLLSVSAGIFITLT